MPDISTSKPKKHEVSKGNLPQKSLLSLSFFLSLTQAYAFIYFAIANPFNIVETKCHMPING